MQMNERENINRVLDIMVEKLEERNYIKRLINEKGYTITDFAEILGVSYDSLRKVLSGYNPLTEQMRRHIMLALQVTPANENMRFIAPRGRESGFTLPRRIWHAIDAEATAKGITTAEYTRQLVITLANEIVDSIILHRTE